VANYYSSSVSVIRDVTGIEEHSTLNASSQTFEVYPNPAKSYFTIRLPLSARIGSLDSRRVDSTDNSLIKIYDVTGKVVKEIAMTALQSRNVRVVRVLLDGIKNGVYFIQLDNQTTTKKLIITK
jgi:hypothetical protein